MSETEQSFAESLVHKVLKGPATTRFSQVPGSGILWRVTRAPAGAVAHIHSLTNFLNNLDSEKKAAKSRGDDLVADWLESLRSYVILLSRECYVIACQDSSDREIGDRVFISWFPGEGLFGGFYSFAVFNEGDLLCFSSGDFSERHLTHK